MATAYSVGNIAYMIESNRYIREGKIIHISNDLITFKFLDCTGTTKLKAYRLYPTEEAALAAIHRIRTEISTNHMAAIWR